MTKCCNQNPMLRLVNNNGVVEFQCNYCGRKGSRSSNENHAVMGWEAMIVRVNKFLELEK